MNDNEIHDGYKMTEQLRRNLPDFHQEESSDE